MIARRLRFLFVSIGAVCALPAVAAELDIERIFAEPALDGPSPIELKLSADGGRVTFLRGKASDRNQMDLWAFDAATGRGRLLVDSKVLSPGEEQLSDEEKARRERQRISARRGIVEYSLSDDGRVVLFPIGGDLYVYDLGKPEKSAVRRITETEPFETDARFSPHARYVSFIREQDLYVYDLREGKETPLTRGGEGAAKNGIAGFIAQEEMDRDTGYWWSPDERHVAFARVDESPVDVVRRFEIHADSVDVVEQRYPAAGTDNVRISLAVVNIEDGGTRWMDLGDEQDIYLARVDWFPDSRHLAVQRQSRDQHRLELLAYDIADGAASVLVTETSDTWVELGHELTFLEHSDRFIWPSSRTGYRHLYLYDFDGDPVRPLTAGEWQIAGAEGPLFVDESQGFVYFTATEASPLERHLYRAALDTRDPEHPDRITERRGWHEVGIAEDGGVYIDTFSSPDTPPQVSLHRLDGSRIAWIEENRLDETHPYHPYLAAHRPREFGTIEAEDGTTLHYEITKPANFDPQRQCPVVIEVYGGPSGQRVTRSWGGYPQPTGGYFRQVLAQDGYVVFALDNRGTGFRGVAFDEPLYRRLGDVEVRDQLAGVEFLRSLPFVDPERIGVFGWSYGGYMALMMLMRTPEAFAAGASGAPVTDWRLYDTHYTERYLADPARNAAGYVASSVFPYAGELSDPLLIIHGMADDNVLFTHSTKLFAALQSAGKPFEMMTYPGSKHGLLRHDEAGAHAYRTIKRFFDAKLRP
ncbi:MAG: S9 family peptidase [Gammaproteobacteria bacterium]